MAIVILGFCMMSSIGGYLWVRSDEEAVLAARQEEKEKADKLENVLNALGQVKSITAQTVEVVNDQPLNIQEIYVHDKMERNLVKEDTTVITGGYDTASVSIKLGEPTEIPSMIIVNNNDNGSVIGATIKLLDETGKVVHQSNAIKDVADVYEYDPNFKTWTKLSFDKVGRNEDGTKIS